MDTLESLDAALAQIPPTPTTDEHLAARATLTARRLVLEQAAKAAAANSRPQPRGNLVVNVPSTVGLSHLYGQNGRVARSRMENGQLVIDLFHGEFKMLLADRKYGNDWHQSNPEALRALGQP